MNLDTSKPIKSVSYNGVDVPVYNAPDNPVLLWTNASPTSAFAPQTISLAAYDGYLIETCYKTSDTSTRIITYLPADGVGRYITMSTAYTANDAVAAEYYATVGSVVKTTNRSSNSNVIPTRIWGVKFTL